MDELEAATAARDAASATELKSAEKALQAVRSALEKPEALLKTASSALAGARSALSNVQLSYQQIGGDWKSIGTDSRAFGAPDWNSINSAWFNVSRAFEAERKASARALDQKPRENAAAARSRAFEEWNAARIRLNEAVVNASRAIAHPPYSMSGNDFDAIVIKIRVSSSFCKIFRFPA